ncbi:MAG: TIM barrel protein [Acidobacteriaceae bacterium]
MVNNGDGNGPRGAAVNSPEQRVWAALDNFRIELPSWGFANTGTRFGKFIQAAAATSLEEKFSDAAQVSALTGAVSSLALHVLWDAPGGAKDVSRIRQLEARFGVLAGSINPNLFQDAEYKFGSICNPDAGVRKQALDHILQSVEIGKLLGDRDISLWIADGSNYPGTQSISRRIGWMQDVFAATHAVLGPNQRMLIEYKPFEPAFYHTDIADWGMALELSRNAGPRARVLVDTGHHYQAQNIEQIVAWLLRLNMLGGFHFNDRKYADDDLTLGSIDPYQVFRIFSTIFAEDNTQAVSGIAYMIDQSHNLKGKMEAMVQTVVTAQELYAKAALVDQAQLAELQDSCQLIEAEECFREAFWADVRPMLRAWRQARGIPADPLKALREGGYVERITVEREQRNASTVSTYA